MTFTDYIKLPNMKTLQYYRRRLVFIALLLFASTTFYLWFHGFPSNNGSTLLLLIPMIIGSLLYGLIGMIVSSLSVFLVLYGLSYGQDVAVSYWFRFTIFFLISGFVSLFVQVQAHYEHRINYLLNHDLWTKLPNRLALWQAIDNQLCTKNMAQSPNGLAVITINNLDSISLTFSHNVADELLLTLWERIIDVFYPGAKAYHYHRERLAVLFHNPEPNTDTLQCKLANICAESVKYDGIPIHFSVYVGYVPIDYNRRGKRTIINEAESALLQAIADDKQLVEFNAEMRRDQRAALAILGSVRMAMAAGELTLHYQPKINLKTNRVVGFEALSRWYDPKFGALSPADFIPLIEKTEIIHDFTYWVIDLALKTIKEWSSDGPDNFIAVNVSSHNLLNESFSDKVTSLLKKYELPPSVLEIEITESEIMKNPEKSIKVLQELSDIPVMISIDDFGTGYSSLACLNRLPATTLKIDRAFISQLNNDEDVKAILTAAIDLGHTLGMTVVAEGIETENQRKILQELGCDIGQGYLFAAAMPESEARSWNWR
ncbi:putative bifunctional diguanylate cyclase/phosphodiesterase [Salinivibrio kushneri]|uniref:putative bifunctional diguanylate cyclase/phosphodiesterase n=1 Tax=Salinivibrio kushneri TaxID=1908198 RepID=UPI0015E14879|nr:GGDEF domain-containing phosphodiesterase [Salinivibrio kushneri]